MSQRFPSFPRFPPFPSLGRFPAGSFLFFLLLTVFFGWPLLFEGQTLAGGDIVNNYLPYKQMVRDQLARGEFPHWNPLTFCGRPLQADVQVGLFYPPNIPFWLLPLEWAFPLVTLFHFWVGGWGMALWTRRRVDSAAACCLAGGIFMFGGFATTRLMSGVVLFPMAMAWLPWLLLCWDRLAESLENGDGIGPLDFCALVFVVALNLLAGAPQIAFYNMAALGLYALVLAWRRSRTDGSYDFDPDEIDLDEEDEETEPLLPFRIRPLLLLAGAAALGAGICAVQILPTKMFVDQSWDRAQGASWEYVVDGSVQPRMLLTFLAPFFFGDPYDEELYWGQQGYHEVTAHVGAVPLFLMVFYLLVRWRWPFGKHRAKGFWANRSGSVRFEVFLLVLLGLSAALAFGRHSPFFWLAYHLVPAFDRFRVPGRLLLYFLFAASALSAWVLDRFVACRGAEKKISSSAASGQVPRDRLVWPLAAVGVLGAVAGVVLWFATPALTSKLEMPHLAFDRIAGHPLAGKSSEIQRQASSGFLWFSLQWCAAGVLLLAMWRTPGRKTRQGLAWVLVCLSLGRLVSYGGHFLTPEPRESLRRNTYPRTERVEFLADALKDGGRFLWFDSVLDWRHDQNQPELLTNRAAMHGLAQLRGYDPVNSRRFGLFMNATTDMPLQENPRGFMRVPDRTDGKIDWRLLALWDCRVALSYRELDYPDVEKIAQWQFPAEFQGPDSTLFAYRLKSPAGPARLCHPMRIEDDAPLEKIAAILGHPDFDPVRMALVKGEPLALLESAPWGSPTEDSPRSPAPRAATENRENPAPPSRGSVTTGPLGRVELIDKKSNSMVFKVAANQPALLVVGQSYYPGWRAKIDGRSMPVCPANLAQCAVPVPAGEHEVRFYYRPSEFDRGAAVSLVSFLLLVLVSLKFKERF